MYSSLPFLKYAASKAQEDNREFFKNFFETDFISNQGRVFGIADAYYFKFRNEANFEVEREKRLAGLTSINDVSTRVLQAAPKELSPKEKKISEIAKIYEIDMSNPSSQGNSTRVRQADIKKIADSGLDPKYFDWIIKILDSNMVEPLDQVIASVKIYSKNADKMEKPIESFAKLSELRDYLDDRLIGNKELYLQKVEPIAKSEKYNDVIYESDNFVVVLPGTTASSQWWAQGTTWCTGYMAGNYFSYYSNNGYYLYYIITKQTSPFFLKSNPKRKICLGYKKIKEGKKIILEVEENKNGGTTVDLENHGLSKSEIVSYLGGEGQGIISKIEQDVMSRDQNKFLSLFDKIESAEDVENLSKYNSFSEIGYDSFFSKIIKNTNDPKIKEAAAKSRANSFAGEFLKNDLKKYPQFERIAMQSIYSEFITDKESPNPVGDFDIPEEFFKNIHKHPDLMDKMVDHASPTMFLKYFSEKYPEKKDSALQATCKLYPFFILDSEEITEEYPEYEKLAVHNAAEIDPRRYLKEYFGLYKNYYPEAKEIAISSMVKHSPMTYLAQFWAKFPGKEDLAAKNLAEKNPIQFLQSFGKHFPQYVHTAGEIFLKQNPFSFYNFADESPSIRELADLKREAAKILAEKNASFFMSKISFKYPDFIEIATKTLAETDPKEFFILYDYDKRRRGIAEFKEIAAENLVKTDPEFFIKRKYYLDFPHLKEEAEKNVSSPDLIKKIEALYHTLAYFGFKKEAVGLEELVKLAGYNDPRVGKKRWSVKQKRGIDCNNPKGFSQRQYCKRKASGGNYKK